MRKLKMRFSDFVSEAALSNTRNSQRIRKLLKTSRGAPEVIEKYQEAFDSLKLGLKMMPKVKNYADKEHIENRLKALKSARRYLESDGRKALDILTGADATYHDTSYDILVQYLKDTN